MSSTVSNTGNVINTKCRKQKRNKKPIVYTEFVNRIDWSRFKPHRAGVVVYTFYEGKILFGLGLDRRFRELTDFGGGIRYTKDKNAILGALREFTEESLHVFGPMFPEQIQNATVSYTQKMAIFFIYIQVNPIDTLILFRERARTIDLPEVADIVWLTMEEFCHTVRYGKTYGGTQMYSYVRKLLRESRILCK